MTYWFGTDLGTFLFPGYNVRTLWGLLSTCLGLAALALAYEGMKIIQIKLQQLTMSPKALTSSSSENSTLLFKISRRSLASPATHCVSWYKWIIQVLLWSAHSTLGYILMMAVMTYNGYISIAIVIGGCLGYWIFGPTVIKLNMDRILETQKLIHCDRDCADTSVNQERRGSAVSVVAEQLITETAVEVHTPNKA